MTGSAPERRPQSPITLKFLHLHLQPNRTRTLSCLYPAMSESINEKSEGSPSTGAQEASLVDVEEAMKQFKIRPVSVYSM